MISTHILDTSLGKAAHQVKVRLEFQNANAWIEVGTESTNSDGRIFFSKASEVGCYRLTFFIEEYYKNLGTKHFFRNIPVEFQVSDTKRKYHVPLLLNPFGYSTYQGT